MSIIGNPIMGGGATEIIVDYDFTLSFSAGTIGTRGAQGSVLIPYPLSKLKSLSIIYTDSSNEYIPVAFASGTNSGEEFIFCNYYRAVSSASSNKTTTVRAVFSK